MNWTGGGLSRSRNARSSLSAKQKNYFAKARSKLQSGRSPRPEVQSFDLGGWKPTIKIGSSPRPNEKRLRQSPGQSTLDAFENIQPVVKQLESLRPRSVSSKRKRTPLQSSNSRTTQRNGQAPDPIILGSSQNHSCVSSSRPSPPGTQPQQSGCAEITGTESIEDKRRRLLELNDWVGLHRPVTKPVRMQFADPADRSLIGRRRKLPMPTDGHPVGKRRMVARAEPTVAKDARAIPAAHDQYYSVDDISIRIGSAVDKTAREGTTGSLGARREQNSVFSDELLDNGALASFHERSSSIHASKSPQSVFTSLRLSDSRNRNALTPSAFLDCSSAASSQRSWDHMGKPVRSSSLARSLESIEPALPNEPSPKAPGFRLVYESSPYSRTSSSEIYRVESPVHDRTDQQETHDDFPKLYATLGNHTPRGTSRMHKRHELSINNFAITTSDQATEALRETDSQDKPAISRRLGGGTSGDAEHLLKPTENRCGSDLPADGGTGQQNVVPRLQPQPQPQTHINSAGEEDGMWKSFTTLQDQDHAASSSVSRDTLPPQNILDSPADKPKDSSQSATKPQAINTSKTTEDEEAIWRKFVFGDEDFNDDAPQELEAGSENLSSQRGHPACTQPSLVAEVDTSPLKQNPHLADETFDDSMSQLSEGSFTGYPEPDLAPTPYAKQRTTRRHRDIYSIPSSETNETASITTAPQPPLPQACTRNPKRSSLVGEASSSAQPATWAPDANISSDELHHSPDSICFLPDKRTDQPSTNPVDASRTHLTARGRKKIIYKKPPRYVGGRSFDAVEPTVLGRRVLRSGRRVIGEATKGKRKG